MPKKATAFAALRVPICAGQKMGKLRNSPSAQTAKLSDPFSAPHKWQRLKRLKVKGGVKSNAKTNNIAGSRRYPKSLKLPYQVPSPCEGEG
ncbi:MAG: hypothetical protein V4447_01745, partial [Pseudomonadota bacterium]